jgi:hypothetical protein
MKVIKLHSQISKYWKFAVDFSGKENRLFSSLKYLESLHAHNNSPIFIEYKRKAI